MRILLATISVSYCAGCLFAQQLPPLTVKEIGLMLRSGYSSETILRDLSARHFSGTLDSAAENELKQANALPVLLDALKSGNNGASKEEVEHQKIAQGNVPTTPPRSGEVAEGLTGTVLPNGDIVNYAPASPSRNTKIAVGRAPAGDIAARWSHSGRTSSLGRRNDAKFNHGPVDKFGLPTSLNSLEARGIQHEHQSAIDEANRAAKSHRADDERQAEADEERYRARAAAENAEDEFRSNLSHAETEAHFLSDDISRGVDKEQIKNDVSNLELS